MEAADGGRVKVLLPPVCFFLLFYLEVHYSACLLMVSVSFSFHRRMMSQLLLLRLLGRW